MCNVLHLWLRSKVTHCGVYTMVCGYAYHIWCNITCSIQNGKQVSNSKSLNQPIIIHLGCWVDVRWTLGSFVSISAVWLVMRGIIKDTNPWMAVWILLWPPMVYYLYDVQWFVYWLIQWICAHNKINNIPYWQAKAAPQDTYVSVNTVSMCIGA